MNIKGYTLLEITITSTLLLIMITISLTFMDRMAKSMQSEVTYKEMQITTQFMLDDITDNLKESKPSMLKVYDWIENGIQQTALCFPTARDKNGIFKYANASGEVQTEPVWQGVCVYAIHNGHLVRYTQYDYDFTTKAMPVIQQITSTQIQLSNGVTFERGAAHGTSNNISTIRGREIVQLIRYPFDADTVVYPLSLKVLVENEFEELQGDVIQSDNYTSIISRNRN